METYLGIALDLGSTSIKCAGLREDGNFTVITQCKAPALHHEDKKVTGDALAYVDKCIELLNFAKLKTKSKTALSLTCQRSSFLVWEKVTGELLSPMISWQDRYYGSENLSEEHKEKVREISGLVPSPYYLGPKLKGWFGENNKRVQSDICVGTLDSYLVWRLSQKREFIIDASMAARTALFDIHQGCWSDVLLKLYSIDQSVLPKLTSTCNLNIELDSHWLLKSMSADQSASLCGHEPNPRDICLNFGTGVFVMKVLSKKSTWQRYYQNALYYKDKDFQYFNEGAVNGLTRSLELCRVNLDSSPIVENDFFCRVDASGLGAPHWRPNCEFMTSSKDFYDCSHTIRRSVFIEGLCFRVLEMIEDLKESESRIIISGGMTHDGVLVQTLASLLEGGLLKCSESETSLRGAFKFIRRIQIPIVFEKVILPQSKYLRGKYEKWRVWMKSIID